MNALGQYLRERCRHLGLSSSELARRAGKSRQTLLSVSSHGNRPPAIETLVQLAMVVQVHPLRLMQLVLEDMQLPAQQQQAYKRRGDKSAFIADVTVPDGQMVMVGSTFTKTWAVQNLGTVPWENRVLTCMDEELMVSTMSGERLVVAQRMRPAVQQIAVPFAAPGAIIELSVDFKAPDTPGACVSYWKSRFADGRLCFPRAVGLSCCVSVISSRVAGDEMG